LLRRWAHGHRTRAPRRRLRLRGTRTRRERTRDEAPRAMRRRDMVLVGVALLVALGLSAVLYVGTMASEPTSAAHVAPARTRAFFKSRGNLRPARTVAEVQDRVGPFAAIVPLQRNMSDNARDVAGFLLVIIVTATTLVVANGRVVSAYRASLGGWRTHLRVLF